MKKLLRILVLTLVFCIAFDQLSYAAKWTYCLDINMSKISCTSSRCEVGPCERQWGDLIFGGILAFGAFGFLGGVFDKKSTKNNFQKAIHNGLTKYFIFEGTASRSEFWYFLLFAVAGSLFVNLIDWLLGVSWLIYDIVDPYTRSGGSHGPFTFEEAWIMATIFSVAVTIPSWAVGARRLHAVGKSGWWQLIELTIIGFIPLIIWWSTEGGKTYTGSKIKSSTSKNDLANELRELKQLYDDGTLSKEEFTKAKNKLLK